MNKVTRVALEDMRLAATFECESCEASFNYGPGFPEYCPECGELFDTTAEKGGKK